MNFLLFSPAQVSPEGIVVVEGDEARRLLKEYDLVEGIRVPGGVLGGERGKFLITKLETDPQGAQKVELRADLTEPPLARFPTIVVVAVPRPQTVKKVLATASAMGADQVHFVRAENTEKSYLDSHAHTPAEIESEVRLGLQQSGDTVAPRIAVHSRFRPFFEDTLGTLMADPAYGPQTLKFFGHTPQAKPPAVILSPQMFGTHQARGVVLAIGPEAGWSEFEADLLQRIGFNPVTLGPRTLRVETALAVFLGEIDMLRGLASTP